MKKINGLRCFLLLVACPLAHAGSSSLTVENDKFFAGTDRHYTQGLKFVWTGDEEVDPDSFADSVAKKLPGLDKEKVLAAQHTYAFGQNLYTPSNTTVATPLPNDRPYAGWLYGSIGYHLLDFEGSSNNSHSIELDFGVVGPAALGEQTQNGWHDIIGVSHANGWSNQLRNEPALDLAYEWRHRWTPGVTADDVRWFDVVPHWGFVVGNVNTYANTGLAVRLGWRLPRDFGPDLIRNISGDVSTRDVRHLGGYFFASSDVRAVGRNIFLDGNTFGSSPSVDKRPLVADLNVGLALRIPARLGKIKAMQLIYAQNYRTKEFYGQAMRDVFGSVSIALLW